MKSQSANTWGDLNEHLNVIELSPDMIAILSMKGEFIQVNQRFEEILGYTPEELIGHPYYEFLHPDFLAHTGDLMDLEIPANGMIEGLEIEYLHKKGSKVFLNWSCHVAPDKGICYAVARNMSAQKEAERRYLTANSMLQERIKELSVLYKFSQILNNPETGFEEKMLLAVECLPAGWQHPAIAASRICIGSHEYKTSNYCESPFQQIAYFDVGASLTGSVETVYTEKVSLEDEEIFLEEEQSMINMLGDMLGSHFKRKQQQDMLYIAEANLRSVFDNTDVGHMLLDKDFKIVTFNQTLYQGYLEVGNFELKVGLNIYNFILSDRKELFQNYISQVEKNREPLKYDTTYHVEGRVTHFHISILPIVENDELIGYCMSVYDITQQKEEEEANQKQIQRLKQLSFITSHELRHEYATLRGMAHIFENQKNLTPELKELLRKSQSSFDRMDQSIAKLNDVIGLSNTVSLGGPNKNYSLKGILLVDDDPITNFINQKLLSNAFHIESITSADSVDKAIQFLKEKAANTSYLILLDINMPVKDGWDFLQELEDLQNPSPVIILSSSIDPDDREKAQSYPAVINFISKPLNPARVNDFLNRENFVWDAI